jgi:hypothetical protein
MGSYAIEVLTKELNEIQSAIRFTEDPKPVRYYKKDDEENLKWLKTREKELECSIEMLNVRNVEVSTHEIRPSIIKVAMLMESVLRENDYKGSWDKCTNHYLFNRFVEEAQEALDEYGSLPYSKEIYVNPSLTEFDFVVTDKLALEIIDTLNIGMMLLDNMETGVVVQHKNSEMKQ